MAVIVEPTLECTLGGKKREIHVRNNHVNNELLNEQRNNDLREFWPSNTVFKVNGKDIELLLPTIKVNIEINRNDTSTAA